MPHICNALASYVAWTDSNRQWRQGCALRIPERLAVASFCVGNFAPFCGLTRLARPLLPHPQRVAGSASACESAGSTGRTLPSSIQPLAEWWMCQDLNPVALL